MFKPGDVRYENNTSRSLKRLGTKTILVCSWVSYSENLGLIGCSLRIRLNQDKSLVWIYLHLNCLFIRANGLQFANLKQFDFKFLKTLKRIQTDVVLLKVSPSCCLRKVICFWKSLRKHNSTIWSCFNLFFLESLFVGKTPMKMSKGVLKFNFARHSIIQICCNQDYFTPNDIYVPYFEIVMFRQLVTNVYFFARLSINTSSNGWFIFRQKN